jgi:hypothetical protein
MNKALINVVEAVNPQYNENIDLIDPENPLIVKPDNTFMQRDKTRVDNPYMNRMK